MAKYNAAVFDLPMTACGDLNSYQYCFVRCASTPGRVELANGSSAPMPLGILQNDPRSLEEATVRILGTSKVWACINSAYKYGDFLSSGSVGQAEILGATGSGVQGVAMEDVAAGASIFSEILLWPQASYFIDNTP